MFTTPAHSQRAGPLEAWRALRNSERAELAGGGETELLALPKDSCNLIQL